MPKCRYARRSDHSQCQIKFTGHCIRMPTEEPANHFVIYESNIRSPLRPGAQKKAISKSNFITHATFSSESAQNQRNKKDRGEKVNVEPKFCLSPNDGDDYDWLKLIDFVRFKL